MSSPNACLIFWSNSRGRCWCVSCVELVASVFCSEYAHFQLLSYYKWVDLKCGGHGITEEQATEGTTKPPRAFWSTRRPRSWPHCCRSCRRAYLNDPGCESSLARFCPGMFLFVCWWGVRGGGVEMYPFLRAKGGKEAHIYGLVGTIQKKTHQTWGRGIGTDLRQAVHPMVAL